MSRIARRTLRRWVTASLFVLLHGVFVLAADEESDSARPAPPLPTDKNLWLNSSPFTWQQLRGKGVCLYFFDCNAEGIEELPKFQEAAKRHAMDPVLFIGVSMGSDRQNTELFLKGSKYTWPTLCDPTYSYCHLCDACIGSEPGDRLVECVCDVLYVTHDGKMVEGYWDDAEMTVTEALSHTAWETDPKEIPEPVWPVWRAVEFHKYQEALPLFKKSLGSGPEPQRAAARKLQELVLAEIDRQATEARSADEADQKWNAYSRISNMQDQFRGYDLPKDLDSLLKKLQRNSLVKSGIVVEKQLPGIGQNLSSPNPVIRKKAQTQLEKVKSDFPDSELAQKAQALLDANQPAPK